MIKKALVLIPLFLSQLSMAAENSRKYLRIGENPVSPGLVLQGEKIFSLDTDVFLTTIDRNRKKHTGWLSNSYHLVGRQEEGKWRAIRIYECGNPILSPRIEFGNANQELPASVEKCRLDGGDWFYSLIGPGLIGYGAGAREPISAGVGGGLIVIELASGSDAKRWKCWFAKKGLIGLASAGIGWLIGNRLNKSKGQNNATSSGGPGPVPPNGIALHF